MQVGCCTLPGRCKCIVEILFCNRDHHKRHGSDLFGLLPKENKEAYTQEHSIDYKCGKPPFS
jgi:hypothetical protein